MLCLYVCMDVCVYGYMSVCLYVCLYVFMYVCMYVCVSIYVWMGGCTMYVRMYVCVRVCVCVYVRVFHQLCHLSGTTHGIEPSTPDAVTALYRWTNELLNYAEVTIHISL